MSEVRPVIEVESRQVTHTCHSPSVWNSTVGLKRVAIVAGIEDAPEGIRVAQQVGAFLDSHEELITGIVDIYPVRTRWQPTEELGYGP